MSEVSRQAWTGELGSALDHLQTQVTPDNVLEIAKRLYAEAERLRFTFDRFGSQVVVLECGGDLVSKDAAAAFTERLQGQVRECRGYADLLEDAARRLGRAARDYGRTDEEIKAIFPRDAGANA